MNEDHKIDLPSQPKPSRPEPDSLTVSPPNWSSRPERDSLTVSPPNLSSRPERDSLIVSRSGETRSSHFDRQLTQALRPVAAPQGFTAKLMDLAAENTQPPARVLSMPLRTARPSVWWSGAIAAALLLAAFTGEQVHQRHQRAQAQQQFDAAMRVTGHALDRTREKLQRAGFNLDN